ncbi:HNH endonuclease signature motif containing protein [Mycolicibacterium sp. XJ1819]
MPTAPPRVCNRCHQPAPKGQPCTCRPPWEGSTHASSNDRQWQAVRDAYIHAHPYCQWPGCHRVADQVDHIVPLAEGGDRYSSANLQSLCTDHHTEKTIRDAQRGKTRPR